MTQKDNQAKLDENIELKKHKKEKLDTLNNITRDLKNDYDNVNMEILTGNKYLSLEHIYGINILSRDEAKALLLDLYQPILSVVESGTKMLSETETFSIEEIDDIEKRFLNQWNKMWTELNNGDVV